MKSFQILLKFLLTSDLTNPSPTQIECGNQLYQSLSPHTTIIAASQTPLLSQLIHPYYDVIVINQHYKQQRFNPKRRTYHSAVILLQCDEELGPIVDTIKRNRIISVRMRLVVIVTGCTQTQQPTSPVEMFAAIDDILRPAYSQIIYVFHNSTTSFYYNTTKINDCRVPPFKEKSFKNLRVSSYGGSPLFADFDSNGINGIEIQILKAISYDMSISWVKTKEKVMPRGVFGPNGSIIGITGILDRFDADLGLGAIPTIYHLAEVTEMLTSHTEDNQKWLVPGPRAAQNWSSLTSVYPFNVWILIIIVFVVFSLNFTLLSAFQKTSNNFLLSLYFSFTKAWAIMLEQGSSLLTHRCLLFFYILYSLIITNAYRSALITALTAEPYEDMIKSPEQAVALGHVAYLGQNTKINMENSAKTEPFIQKMLQEGRHFFYPEVSRERIIKEVAESGKGIILCPENESKTIILGMTIRDNAKPNVMFLKERRNVYSMSMYLSPGSGLFHILNRRTLCLLEGGLVAYWVEQRHRSSLLKVAVEHVHKGPKKLTIHHYKTVFTLLLPLLLLSCSVFLGECCWKNKSAAVFVKKL